MPSRDEALRRIASQPRRGDRPGRRHLHISVTATRDPRRAWSCSRRCPSSEGVDRRRHGDRLALPPRRVGHGYATEAAQRSSTAGSPPVSPPLCRHPPGQRRLAGRLPATRHDDLGLRSEWYDVELHAFRLDQPRRVRTSIRISSATRLGLVERHERTPAVDLRPARRCRRRPPRSRCASASLKNLSAVPQSSSTVFERAAGRRRRRDRACRHRAGIAQCRPRCRGSGDGRPPQRAAVRGRAAWPRARRNQDRMAQRLGPSPASRSGAGRDGGRA